MKKLHDSLNGISKLWAKMNNLLSDVSDPALFLRAFTPGFQEYIEALCFLRLVETSDLPTCGEILEKTKFDFENAGPTLFAEIILGIADIAGEVMRFATNMVSKGIQDYNKPAKNFLQQMYLLFFKIAPDVNKEVNKKIWALRGSMIKVMF